MRRLLPIAVLAAFLASPSPVRAAGKGEIEDAVPVRIDLRDRSADLDLLNRLDIDVDGVYDSWLRAYVITEEMEKLRALGFAISPLPETHGAEAGAAYTPAETFAVPTTYHTYETLTAELSQVAVDHPDIVRLYSLGNSLGGRTLWMVKISDNPDAEEDEPEVRYIGAMHGDEVVGKEMLVNLIHLLTDGYGTDPRMTSLVDDLEIWILPSMNPDGTASVRRYNNNNVDLNRDFPDQWTDPTDSPAGREPEVQHVMNWGYAHNVVLSANFHGGSLVANYPYDSTANGTNVYSLTPDDALWISLARTYADPNGPMRVSNSDASFTNGICNGADWYVVNGGMQDWNYVWRGGKELTLEVSTVKWPSGNMLPQFWEENRESMLRYLERAREGVRGIVRDAATHAPLPATVRVVGSVRDTKTDPDAGDYQRLLLPGTYSLEFSSPGYATARRDGVVVSASTLATRVDVDLAPLAAKLQPTSHRVVDGGDLALDPGETADLAVTVKNLGSLATGVTAELVPTGWLGTVARADAAYPSLGAGASAESAAPHFAVAVPASAPAGAKAGFALRWTAAEGSGVTAPFFVPTGAPTCFTVAATDVPKSIVDRGTASSTLTVPTDLEISDVNVRVDLTHPYVGDLHVRLISPSGVPVALHSRTGGSSDNIHAWYDTDVAPNEPLARFFGGHSAGTWRLEVVDGVPANAGTLTGFSVEVCGRPFEVELPAMRIDRVERDGEGVALTWWPYPGAQSYRVYRTSDPRVASFEDITAEDGNALDTSFVDASSGDAYWLVSGIGVSGEGPVSGTSSTGPATRGRYRAKGCCSAVSGPSDFHRENRETVTGSPSAAAP